MTDQEIIKALECCANELGCEKCPANPHRGNYGFCTAPLIKSAFDLITRQQAEIEEFEKLEDKLKAEKADVMYFKRQIKSEAVREFAKKTDEMITEIYNNHIFGNNDLEAEEKDAIINFSTDVVSGFDNLVEEMVGDQK